ncbi:DUF397 domain-containing protein [Streptomyces violaceusniger]|uniref:DUF397 domain-containing protein n=1 Tax=Streptomyces violaceusniger (strain Tu 4113) TaxID=653045 RepID=G2NW66_STRV4|nr:DUF397 domain-containing protein [Streptomyces violaceusniger]AEM86676.1 protein of unknown function DUF397 [Streptomyces violaceusniger Tu 4113]
MSFWRKSTFSSGQVSAECVEVATPSPGLILIRESDDPAAVITTDPAPWAAFIRGLKRGDFDHLPGSA